MALTYNTLLASTIKHFKKGFVDNIIKDHILLAALGQKDLASSVFGMRTPEAEFAEGIKLIDGGEKIFCPLMYQANATVAGYSGYDTLDINPTDPFTAAEYSWASVAGSVNMDNDRLDKNRGDQYKLFDLMKGQVDNLRVSIQQSLNDMLIASKTDTKQPLGLLDLIKDDPTTNPGYGNIGGIDAATDATWWRNQVVDNAAASFGTDQTGTGQANLRKLIRQCTFGIVKPNLILGGDTAFEKLENSMVNYLRIMQTDKEKALAKAGFDAIMFKGIPVVMEKRILALRGTAGLSNDAFYAINTKFMKVYGMKHRWFEPSNVKEPVNQDTQVMHIITRLQLTTDNRRALGVMINVS